MTNAPFKRQVDFIERSIALRDEQSAEFNEIGYWARVWVQASLPHSDPGKVNVWGRENGSFSLTVQPGIDIVDGREVNFGIPYGTIPRLLMCWMCTEAVRTRTPKLFLGESLAEFMATVGIGSATGGRWGSITRLKQQLKRLFEARISYRWRGNDGSARKSIEITNEEVLWWSEDKPDQSTLFRSYIVLGDAFFKDVITRPIPVKMEALRLLKQSPLALDLYTWLTYRVFGLSEPLAVGWATLENQLGSEYRSTDEFARRCKQHLRKIKLVYPDLRFEFPRGRLLVLPSPTHVAPKRAVDKSVEKRKLSTHKRSKKNVT